MLRAALQFLVPFLLPTALYLLWVAALRWRAGDDGEEGAAAPRYADGPWLLLAGAGLLLATISLFAFGLTTGGEPGEVYRPARMIDGRIVPGGSD